LPINLRQQQFLPALGAVDVAPPQLGRQAIPLPGEHGQRMIASGFEMSVVSALLLLPVNKNLGGIHVQNHSLMSSPKRTRSSNSRTKIGRPSEVTSDPWKSIFKAALKES